MDIYALCREAIASALPGHTEKDVRIPARHAAMSVYAPEIGSAAAEAFPDVLGVPPVRSVTARNGWLLFALTDAFYDACVRKVLDTLPKSEDDLGSYALNRMRALSRQAGTGCPQNAYVQRALWLLLGAAYGHGSANEAEKAFLRMFYALPVSARMEARRTCGETADACARLYVRALTTE